MSGRLFNEKEVSEILKRASSSRSRADLASSDGISLEELQQVGAELGFDPSQIELAARQLGSKPSTRDGFLGPRIVLDRTVEGEVTADDWQGMIAAVQRYHKGAGAVTQRGLSYDWAGSEEGASLALTVKVKDGQSRIRLESNRWMGIVMTSAMGSMFGFAFSAILFKHGNYVGGGLLLAFFATLVFTAITLFHKFHSESVSALMERLVEEVGSGNSVHALVNSTQVVNESKSNEQSVQA